MKAKLPNGIELEGTDREVMRAIAEWQPTPTAAPPARIWEGKVDHGSQPTHQLTDALIEVYEAMEAVGEPVTNSYLARRLRITKGAVSGRLNALRHMGLVQNVRKGHWEVTK